MDQRDFNKAIESAKSGNTEQLLKSLNSEQRAMLNKVMSDKNEAKKLLSSPQAAAILKALAGK